MNNLPSKNSIYGLTVMTK